MPHVSRNIPEKTIGATERDRFHVKRLFSPVSTINNTPARGDSAFDLVITNNPNLVTIHEIWSPSIPVRNDLLNRVHSDGTIWNAVSCWKTYWNLVYTMQGFVVVVVVEVHQYTDKTVSQPVRIMSFKSGSYSWLALLVSSLIFE